MGKLHLILPMGGAGSRFEEAGYHCPKPLIELQGRPFFYWAAMSVLQDLAAADLSFVVLQEHVDRFHIDARILSYFPGARIHVIEKVLPGSVYTCLEGVQSIDDALPVLFNDCDHAFQCHGLAEAIEEGSNALLTFKSQRPVYSYVRYDGNQLPCGTVEKQVVSEDAICGAYLFQSAGFFRSLAEAYLADCPYTECFMSGLYNTMYQRGYAFSILPLDWHLEFGTPEEYQEAQKAELLRAKMHLL